MLPEVIAPNADVKPPERIIVGGQFNRWLNISSVITVQGAEDPDSKLFMCELCQARGTPSEQCNTANFTLNTIGAPPKIQYSGSLGMLILY